MKALHILTATLLAAFATQTALAKETAPAATITFEYNGTKANGFTISTGSFTFSDAGLSSITLSDLTAFTLHQTSSNASGTAVGIFDFTQADLLSFAVSLSGGQVTSAMFETDFDLQTSSPTNTDFKPQNFMALSATTAKTQYRALLSTLPPTDDTAGPISFSSVPEPSTAVLLISGFGLLALRRNRTGSPRLVLAGALRD